MPDQLDLLRSSRPRHLIVGVLAVLLVVRLIILTSDVLRSRGFPGPGETVPGVPELFDPHVPAMRMTSLAVVTLMICLVAHVRGGAGRLTATMLAGAGLGFAIASFFGPTRWILSVPGPMIDQLGDTGGYARLLTAEVLLDLVVGLAVLRCERRARPSFETMAEGRARAT